MKSWRHRSAVGRTHFHAVRRRWRRRTNRKQLIVIAQCANDNYTCYGGPMVWLWLLVVARTHDHHFKNQTWLVCTLLGALVDWLWEQATSSLLWNYVSSFCSLKNQVNLIQLVYSPLAVSSRWPRTHQGVPCGATSRLLATVLDARWDPWFQAPAPQINMSFIYEFWKLVGITMNLTAPAGQWTFHWCSRCIYAAVNI